jgi:hypothetical protein
LQLLAVSSEKLRAELRFRRFREVPVKADAATVT